MNADRLKEYLILIAENVIPQTQLEDIYEQLALLADIDESEEQGKNSEILSQDQVKDQSKEWLR